ncbi:DUF1150 domain-containing protein [Rhodobacteraceae bacterium]|nr:DUF1150 domain-containing protein [Paracoccaceae bacterium]
MDTPFDFKGIQQDRLVYIRPVNVSDLPKMMRAQAQGQTRIYAVHSSDGERLALVRNRKLAFELARQNEFAPVNVH